MSGCPCAQACSAQGRCTTGGFKLAGGSVTCSLKFHFSQGVQVSTCTAAGARKREHCVCSGLLQENMARMLLVADVQGLIKSYQGQIVASLKDPDIRSPTTLLSTWLWLVESHHDEQGQKQSAALLVHVWKLILCPARRAVGPGCLQHPEAGPGSAVRDVRRGERQGHCGGAASGGPCGACALSFGSLAKCRMLSP